MNISGIKLTSVTAGLPSKKKTPPRGNGIWKQATALCSSKKKMCLRGNGSFCRFLCRLDLKIPVQTKGENREFSHKINITFFSGFPLKICGSGLGKILRTVFLLSFSGSAFAASADPPGLPVFDTPLPHIVYGGAGVASLKPDLSYLINPSILAGTAGQAVAAYSVKSFHQTALLSVTDKHTMIPAGVTFQREWDSRKKDTPLHRWSFSVGSKIIPSFSLGAVIHRETAKNKPTRWNGGAGALFRLGRRAALGAALSDLLIYESKNRRILRFGLYCKWARLLSGQVDMSYSVKHRWVIRGGAETLINRFIALRGGGLWSFEEEKALFSGGVGFYGPRLQLDYALQKDLKVFHHVITGRLLF